MVFLSLDALISELHVEYMDLAIACLFGLNESAINGDFIDLNLSRSLQLTSALLESICKVIIGAHNLVYLGLSVVTDLLLPFASFAFWRVVSRL